MKLSRYKINITSLLLVLFLAMKLTGLHAMSHIDDVDDTCAICDHAITHNLTPSIAPDSNDIQLEHIIFLIPIEVTNNYSYSTTSSLITRALFSRPPPIKL